ncbi:hypothetical protein [Herbaspirillum huttiense]|uniref:hypothetical protein n=1 Tax=Herbaspirillum huttiense TaxID=863372 RepID=UPI0039AFF88B
MYGIDSTDSQVVIDRLLRIGLETTHGESVHEQIGAALEFAASRFEGMTPHHAKAAWTGMLAQLRQLACLIAQSSPWQAEVLMDAYELARAGIHLHGGK